MVATWIADTSAYGVGSSIGKRKLAPLISPHKTWEGTMAAVLVTPLVLAFLTFFPKITISERIFLGFLIGITSQLGDLAESKLKREMKVKDAGWLIPGHGGILDRFDSLLFGGVVAYYYLKFIM
jgi:phosphatidate cytidylyltransferase